MQECVFKHQSLEVYQSFCPVRDKEQHSLEVIRRLSPVRALLSDTCRLYYEQRRLMSVSVKGKERQGLGKMLR